MTTVHGFWRSLYVTLLTAVGSSDVEPDRSPVAQAARRVLDQGAIATYQHDPLNIASSRVAEASGFPDRGWRSLGMW